METTIEKIDIKNLVGKDVLGNNKQVLFDYYRAGVFYYLVSDYVKGCTYSFPVPIEDISGSTLLCSDKAITFMRWIRKAIQEGTLIKKSYE